jgi:hypothetical protein
MFYDINPFIPLYVFNDMNIRLSKEKKRKET